MPNAVTPSTPNKSNNAPNTPNKSALVQPNKRPSKQKKILKHLV